MRELIAITDVTEMEGDQVCIAGVTQDLECIRPVVKGGVRLWSLYENRRPVIYPSAKVWMDFSTAEVVPPHIEDRTFDFRTIELKDAFEARHWESLLRQTSFHSVQDVFDGTLEERRVAPGTETRSLGTIKNVTVLDIQPDGRFERVSVRMDFRDESGEEYRRFPVNDLAFRGLFSQLRDRSRSGQAAARELFRRIEEADRVYLRVGLTRPVEVGGYDESCWVQVTGVYTFPDYLGGKTWADFAT